MFFSAENRKNLGDMIDFMRNYFWQVQNQVAEPKELYTHVFPFHSQLS